MGSKVKKIPVTVLLVDDQVIIAEAMRRMLADQKDIRFHYCNDPTKAMMMAAEVKPTVILQDLVMPDVDGLTLVKYFRANPATRDVPLIVLSVKEDPKIKAEAFSLGVNDYAVKLPDKVELLARIRYHSKAYTRLLERNLAYEQLAESQRALNSELAEAADYVRSLLPAPLQNGVDTLWRYIPSMQLGGDAFGYHWIDKEHFAIYLLDVCGHGVGAAMLSISIMNVLRGKTLARTDFLDPADVLSSLNSAFPMEQHNNMFFTMWYGVYNKRLRELVYASGGHPPAILFTGTEPASVRCLELKTPGMVVGGMQEARFQSATCKIERYSRLYLFSDGVYELTKSSGDILTLDEFIHFLTEIPSGDVEDLDHILHYCRTINRGETFDDDFSILKVSFK